MVPLVKSVIDGLNSWMRERAETKRVKHEVLREGMKARAAAEAEYRKARNARLLANSAADNRMDEQQQIANQRSIEDEILRALLVASLGVGYLWPDRAMAFAEYLRALPWWHVTLVVLAVSAKLAIRGPIMAAFGFNRGGGRPRVAVGLPADMPGASMGFSEVEVSKVKVPGPAALDADTIARIQQSDASPPAGSEAPARSSSGEAAGRSNREEQPYAPEARSR